MNSRFAMVWLFASVALVGTAIRSSAQAPEDLTAAPEVLADTSKLAVGVWALDLRWGLGIAQSAYSNNWKSGDKGSIAWVSNLEFEAERQFSPLFNWYSVLLLSYGETANQIDDPDDPGENKWAKPEKTSDQIYVETVGRFSIGAWVDPYAALRLDSFFSDESNPIGSILFDPVTLKESAGVARVFHRTETRSLVSRLGFGFRQSFDKFFADSLGNQTETNEANDGGFEFQTDYKEPVFDGKSVFESQLLVFAPVFYSQSEDLEAFDQIALAADPTRDAVADYWRVPNATWRNRLVTKLSSIVSFNLYLELAYQKFDPATPVDTSQPASTLIPVVDSGIRKGVQIRQTFTFGLSFDVL
jgi:hypothetical protein